MARPTFTTVDAYIASLPEAARPALAQVRAALRAAIPDGEEGIAYGIPVVRLDGRYLLYFAGFKGHVGVYPVTAGLRASLGPELEPRIANKATIRFPLGEPVPTDLVRRIAEVRVAEAREEARARAEARAQAKADARAARPPELVPKRRPRAAEPTQPTEPTQPSDPGGARARRR